jgi:translation initiation factor 3 subunit L
MYFYRNVLENNVYELHNVYDSSFNKLTNKYYQKQPWPEAELIAPLVNDGKARRIEAG